MSATLIAPASSSRLIGSKGVRPIIAGPRPGAGERIALTLSHRAI